MKLKDFQFYVMYKTSFNGKMEHYDVIPGLLAATKSKKTFHTYDKDFNLKPITTKDELRTFIDRYFSYHYWAKCEWEFIATDWPNGDGDGRPQKIDVYHQLEPNIDLITEIFWENLKDKLKKQPK